jgi:M6 family metalloprotease-like protein
MHPSGLRRADTAFQAGVAEPPLRGLSGWLFPARLFLPRAPQLFVLVLLLLQPAGIGAQTTRLIPVRPMMGAASRSGSGVRTGIAAARTARTSAGIPIPPPRPHLNLARPAGLRSSPRAVLARTVGGDFRPEEAGGLLITGPVLPDTLRVLVLRVVFPADDDPETTGDGSFDLRTLEQFESEEGHAIDAAPHDRGYVERHLRALHHYWWAASDGALNIAAQVLPSAAQGAFLLPHGIAHYGFRSPLGSIETALSTLVADAVAAAGAAAATGGDPIEWTAWDAFVVFHAGADWQGDMAGARDTPADIPTAYLALGEPVAVGGTWVRDATILPETVSQDGWTGAINGIFAHEFGHQLGLLDLYDVEGNDTAVGYFALMDLGDVVGGIVEERYVFGLLPAGISPWTRAYLGWAQAAGPGPDGTITLKASTALEGIHDPSPGAKVGRVRLGESQWLLAEYRSDDLDGQVGVSLYWDQGVIDGTARLQGEEKVRTYEYDALLPGAGVLFWHLDEAVAFLPASGGGTNLEANTLQADRLRRFLDVEEADGLQELGWLPGYYGDPGDFWGPGADGSDGPAVFSPATEPSTASWTGARTGITITVTADGDPLGRRLSVASGDPALLFTVPFPDPSPTASVPWLIDLHGSIGLRIAVLDSLGGLHYLNENGLPAIGANPVWTAPVPPRYPLTRTSDQWVVASGDSLYWIDDSGAQTAAVDLGGPVLVRPVGSPGPESRVTVAQIGGRLVQAEPTGIVRSVVLADEIVRIADLCDGALVATTGTVYEAIPTGTTFQVEPVWTGGGGSIVDLVAARASGAVTFEPDFAVLDEEGDLTLRLRSPEFLVGNETASPGGLTSRQRIPAVRGALAIGILDYSWDPVVMVPTGEGMSAFQLSGPRFAGWPPAGRGRAAVTYPLPVGDPLLLSQAAVLGLTEADEVLRWDPTGKAAVEVPVQLTRRSVTSPTLGIPSLSATARLLVVEPDSLRLLSVPVTGQSQLGNWLGPQGGPYGLGMVAVDTEYGLPLYQPPNLYAYPNPVRNRCTVRVEHLIGTIRIRAYTRTGSFLGEVAVLSSGTGSAAEQVWDVSRLAPGVYHLVGVTEGSGIRRETLRTTVLVVR